MVAEDVAAELHENLQHCAAVALRQVVGYWSIRNVVGRLRFCRAVEWSNSFRAIDQDVAVTNSGVKLQATSAPSACAVNWSPQGLLHRLDQFAALGVADVARGEVAHLLVVHVYQVAADGPVGGA